MLLLLVALLVACNAATVNKKQTILMPGHVEVYNPLAGENLKNPASGNSKLKIYTLIDVSCSTCILKLEKWTQFQSEAGNVAVIPVCHSGDNFEMLKYLFENNRVGKVRLPLVLDLDNQFKKQNPELISKYGELTALTDNSNHVLLTGNPIDDKSDKEKFMKLIRE